MLLFFLISKLFSLFYERYNYLIELLSCMSKEVSLFSDNPRIFKLWLPLRSNFVKKFFDMSRWWIEVFLSISKSFIKLQFKNSCFTVLFLPRVKWGIWLFDRSSSSRLWLSPMGNSVSLLWKRFKIFSFWVFLNLNDVMLFSDK